MKTLVQTTAGQVNAYCTQIGADPLLVQGAGGNVSWKDGEVLWVKASGTWLAHAENKEIFIPVDLAHLRAEISEENFSAVPKVLGDTSLKPSIETMLHALMPHKIVVHIHAVEILAHMVRENPLADLKKLIDDAVKWVFVDYFKPGSELAQAVSAQLAMRHDADVVFLKNHGLVIGGADIKCIEHSLGKLLSQLKIKTLPFEKNIENEALASDFLDGGYVLSSDMDVRKLATNTELASRLLSDWALYPDHIVFLGEKAFVVTDASDLSILANTTISPNFIFVTGKGVYENASTTDAHKAQLRCYYDVLVRQERTENITSLNSAQIAELLNWDAEKYRQNSVFMKRDIL